MVFSEHQPLIVLFILLFLVGWLSIICLFYKPPRFDPLIVRLRQDVLQLDPRLSHLKFFSSDESYIRNKESIYLCLRDEQGAYYDYNMLMYVAIHECAHALSSSYDDAHETEEFQYIFQTLLKKAEHLGIYDSSKPLLQHYCGIDASKPKRESFSSHVFRWLKH